MRYPCGTGTPYPSLPLHLARHSIKFPAALLHWQTQCGAAASGKVIPHQPTSTYELGNPGMHGMEIDRDCAFKDFDGAVIQGILVMDNQKPQSSTMANPRHPMSCSFLTT